jgi:hypothetical protein
VDAAQQALSSLGAGGVEKAEHIVSVLVQFGWIEVREGHYATAHDVVADDVLEQTLLGAGGVRRTVLAAVLSVACNSPRSFGRLANSMQRLVTGIDATDGSLIEEALGAWLSEHVRPVASALVTEDIDIASYALGAALDGPPWSSSIIGLWDVLVSPWLRTHGRSPAARHLYYRGLRSVPNGAAAELLNAADRWLDTYPTLQEAGFVLAPLLRRTDLEAGEAQKAVTAGFRWFDTYPTLQEAGFVLAPLLGRTDLEAGEAQKAVTAGFRWFDTYPTLQEAGFVLAPLLGRTDLEAGEAQKAVTAALGWLAEHAATDNAEFIFRYLFRRPEPSRLDRSKAAELAIHRLQAVLDTQEASFLLRTLLGDRYLDPDLNIRVVQFGLEWLDVHPADPASDFVFNRILRIPHVDDGSWGRAAGHAFDGLKPGFDMTVRTEFCSV